MNKNIILIAAVALGAVLVLNRAAKAAAPAASRSAPIQNLNQNREMWVGLLGDYWKDLEQNGYGELPETTGDDYLKGYVE